MSRSKTFVLANGLEIFGGFAGGESTLAERDIESNVTILSGDLDGDDDAGACQGVPFCNRDDNAWHVVSSGDDNVLGTRLDGFTSKAAPRMARRPRSWRRKRGAGSG